MKKKLWLKAAHLETVKDRTVQEVNSAVNRVHNTYDDLQTYTNMALVSIVYLKILKSRNLVFLIFT